MFKRQSGSVSLWVDEQKELWEHVMVLSRVVLKNISWFTGEKDLKYYFGRFGEVLHVKLLYDWETGLHRGFAFITFENIDDALKAVQQRYHYINGRRVVAKIAIPSSKRRQQ